MIETNDLLSLLLSAYKDYVQNIEIENVKEEFIKLQISLQIPTPSKMFFQKHLTFAQQVI